MITEIGARVIIPGFTDEMPERDYHAHPSLSSTQARTLLDSPARYRWERDHPKPPTREMQLGTCLHTTLLDAGQHWEELPEGDGRTAAVKEAKREIEARGHIALSPDEAAKVKGMAAAVLRHPEAGPLLAGDGIAERSLFWRDPATGVDCRARPDWLLSNGRAIVDLKTTGDASRNAIGKHIDRYGYHIQKAWYEDGARRLDLAAEDSTWLWVFVEREAPHMVTVATLAPVDAAIGADLAARAREIYRDCAEVDLWPNGEQYPDHIVTTSLPPWSRRSYEEEQW